MKGLNFVCKGTISELFGLVTTVTRYFGVFPFVIKDNNVVLSIVHLVWSIFIIVLLVLVNLSCTYFEQPFMTNLSTMLLYLIQCISFSLTHIVSLIRIVCNRNNIRTALKTSKEVEQMLNPCENVLNLSEIAFFTCLIIGLTLFDFSVHDMAEQGGKKCAFSHYISAAMILAITFNFSFSVTLTRTAFSILNTKLSQLNSFGDIANYLESYDKLVSTVDVIGNIFNLQLLMILTSYFVLITSSIYYLVFIFDSMDLQVVSVSTWILIFTKTIHHLISTCYSTKSEAAEFNKILYRLILEDKTGQLTQNPKVLLHFSNQRSVVFTACGFFSIDFTLASSMIAAATTYLVILMQMGGSEKS